MLKPTLLEHLLLESLGVTCGSGYLFDKPCISAFAEKYMTAGMALQFLQLIFWGRLYGESLHRRWSCLGFSISICVWQIEVVLGLCCFRHFSRLQRLVDDFDAEVFFQRRVPDA